MPYRQQVNTCFSAASIHVFSLKAQKKLTIGIEIMAIMADTSCATKTAASVRLVR